MALMKNISNLKVFLEFKTITIVVVRFAGRLNCLLHLVPMPYFQCSSVCVANLLLHHLAKHINVVRFA